MPSSSGKATNFFVMSALEMVILKWLLFGRKHIPSSFESTGSWKKDKDLLKEYRLTVISSFLFTSIISHILLFFKKNNQESILLLALEFKLVGMFLDKKCNSLSSISFILLTILGQCLVAFSHHFLYPLHEVFKWEG